LVLFVGVVRFVAVRCGLLLFLSLFSMVLLLLLLPLPLPLPLLLLLQFTMVTLAVFLSLVCPWLSDGLGVSVVL